MTSVQKSGRVRSQAFRAMRFEFRDSNALSPLSKSDQRLKRKGRSLSDRSSALRPNWLVWHEAVSEKFHNWGGVAYDVGRTRGLT